MHALYAWLVTKNAQRLMEDRGCPEHPLTGWAGRRLELLDKKHFLLLISYVFFPNYSSFEQNT